MRVVTDNITNIRVDKDNSGNEFIVIDSAHGKVEITIPAWGAQNAAMTTQVFQAISEVTMATVETSCGRYFSGDFPNTHNTEVIR